MTRPTTHIFRLLRWGRILARHGALRIIEEGPATPAPVRRLCRIARFATIQPRVPDYAAAFRAIGPAAIKLGQTLATRPDLVGEEAARNLLTLLASCVLSAIVSAGLPSERVVAVAEVAEGPREPLRFAFTRMQLGLVLGCCTLVAALIVLLGVGVGSKSLRPHGGVQHVSVYEYGAMAPGGLQ